MLSVLSLLLIGVIFLQAPKQESLGNAFSNLHQSTTEKVLTFLTFTLFIVTTVYLYFR